MQGWGYSMRAWFTFFLLLSAATCVAEENPGNAGPPGPGGPTPQPTIPAEFVRALSTSDTSPLTSGGAAGNLTPDQFTGTSRYSLSFPLPPLRGFEPPAPVLTYSSRSLERIAGFGWTLDFGAIVRIERNFGAETTFQHNSRVGAVSLVELSAFRFTPEFTPPYSDYRVLGDDFGNGWEMTDDKGARFRYGTRLESRLPAGALGSAVKKWLLDEVIDPNGNVTSIYYTSTDNTAYISEVRYGAHRDELGAEDIAPFVSYFFDYESRPDNFDRFDSGYISRVSQRLSRLRLVVDGTLQRTYALNYMVSPQSGRSLLSKMVESGPDGTSRPPTSFEYYSSPPTFAAAKLLVPANSRGEDGLRWPDLIGAQSQFASLTGGTIPSFCVAEQNSLVCRLLNGRFENQARKIPDFNGVDFSNFERGLIRLVDLRGSGRLDVCLLQDSGLDCWVNEGDYFRAWPGPKWSVSDPITAASLRFGRVNGDDYLDVCRIGAVDVECVQGSPDGFKLAPGDLLHGPKWDRRGAIWSNPAHYSSLALSRITGDQADDICGRDDQGIVCYKSTSSGFDLANPIRGPAWTDIVAPLPTEPLPDGTDWSKSLHYGTIAFVDFQGKGLAGVCGRTRDGIVCYRNLGGSFDLTNPVNGPAFSGTLDFPTLSQPYPEPKGWAVEGRWRSVAYIDINGDGAVDICGRDATGFRCALANSGQFMPLIAGPALPDSFEGDWMTTQYFATLRFVDTSGSGQLDLCGRSNKGVQCWLNQTGPSDLLSKITESAGGTTLLTYAPASTASDSRLSVPVKVLQSIEKSDGRGGLQRKEFYYSSGLYDALHRDFRGFREVEVRDLDRGVHVRTLRMTFAQATRKTLADTDRVLEKKAPMKGRLLRTEVVSPSGAERDRSDLEYEMYSVGPSIAVFNVLVRTQHCSSTCATGLTSEFDFDPNTGNMIEQRQIPGTGQASDQITKTYRYAVDRYGNGTNRVTEIRTFRGVGTRVEELKVKFGYDENHACDAIWIAGRQEPPSNTMVIGNLTSIWKSGRDVALAVSLSGFDGFGNIVCARTPSAGLVTTAFDNRRIVAVRSENALGHVTSTSYEGINSPPGFNFGAIVRRKAPNGLITAYSYDSLGRLLSFNTGGYGQTTQVAYLEACTAALRGLRFE